MTYHLQHNLIPGPKTRFTMDVDWMISKCGNCAYFGPKMSVQMNHGDCAS